MFNGLPVSSIKKVFALSSVFRVSWLLAGGMAGGLVFLGVYTLGFLLLVGALKEERAEAIRSMQRLGARGVLLAPLGIAMANFAGLPPFALFY